MLAYVFWHRPRSGADIRAYESGLLTFHERLRDANVSGFLRSLTVRTSAAPWLDAGDRAYEDWYLVTSSAALDALNDAAVSGARSASHDAVAAVADEGAGGLYSLRNGAARDDAPAATWFAKPAGMTYAAFDAVVVPFVERTGAALWQRRMVLGPAPEFCMMAAEAVALPAPLTAFARAERSVIAPALTR